MGEILNILEANAIIFWIGICLVCLVIENLTLGLSTIWFSIGALCALLSVFLLASFWVQFIIFLVVSLVLLLFTRKIFVNKLKIGKEKTNLDALIGKKTVLVKEILPFSTGSIKINGQEWTAVGEEVNAEIKAGSEVEVVAIKGVKAVVRTVL